MGDFKTLETSENKIKKSGGLSIELVRTRDI